MAAAAAAALAPPPGPDLRRVFLEKQATNLQRACSTVKRFDEAVGPADFSRFSQEFMAHILAAGRDFFVTLEHVGDIAPAVLFDPANVTSDDLNTMIAETVPQLRQRALLAAMRACLMPGGGR